MRDLDLEIARRLLKRQPYNVISKELKVSVKTIARVKRLIEAGAIMVGEDENPYFAGKPELEHAEEEKDVMPLAYRIMRALGASDPKEALEQAYSFIVKINPYILYYGVKTPEQLISLLEGRIEKMKRQLEAYGNEDPYSMARRLGIKEETIRYYQMFRRRYGWKGSFIDYLNDAAEYIAMQAGLIRRERRGNVIVTEYEIT